MDPSGDVPTASFTVSGVLSRLAAWSALAVAMMYAVGRLFAEIYYREFGIGASSVGLSTADLVGQAAGSAIWLVILAAPGLFLAGISKATRRKLWMTDDTTKYGWKTYGALLATVFLVIGVPAGALFVFGDPLRIGDYGIPVAAFGLGIVLYNAKARSEVGPENTLTNGDANGRVEVASTAEGPASTKEGHADPSATPSDGRSFFTSLIVGYTIVALVGIVIGV